MSYVKSDKIFVYPTAHRGDYYNPETELNIEYNPEAKLNTEYNITDSVSSILSTDGFVVSWDRTNRIMKFFLKGYSFEIIDDDAQNTIFGNSNVYAFLNTKNTSLAGYRNLKELCDADDTNPILDNNGLFKALELGSYIENNEIRPYIHLWDGSDVPASSYIKVNLNNVSDVNGDQLVGDNGVVFNEDLSVVGRVSISDLLNVDGEVELQDNLNVYGRTELYGYVGIGGKLNADGEVDFNDVVSFKDAVTFDDDATINGKLTVTNGIDSTNNVNDLGHLNFNFNNIKYGNYSHQGSMPEITQENWDGYLGMLNDSNYFYSNGFDDEKIKITPSTEYASNRQYYKGTELNFDEIEQVHINNKTESRESDYDTGALTVSGGVGVGGNINVKGNLYANGDVKAHKFTGSLEGGLFTTQIDYSVLNDKHKVILGGAEPISSVILLSLPSHQGTFVCRGASTEAKMSYNSVIDRYEAIELGMIPLHTYNVTLDFFSSVTGSSGLYYKTSVSLGLIKIPSNHIEYDSCVPFTCRYCKDEMSGGIPVYSVFNGILHIFPNSENTSYVEVLDDSGHSLSLQTGLSYINISYERFE